MDCSIQVLVLRQDPALPSAMGRIEDAKRTAQERPWALVRQLDPLTATPDEVSEIASLAGQAARIVVRTRGEPELAWMPAARSAFERLVAVLEGANVPNLCLWPHAAAAVSDVPSILSFMAAPGRADRWRFLLDPVSLLTPSMMARAEDHLTRLFEALAQHPSLAAVLLAEPVSGESIVELGPLRSQGPWTTLM